MAVNLQSSDDVDAWAFVRSLVTLALVSPSRYTKDRALMLIDIEASPFLDESTRNLVTMFTEFGIEEADMDIKTWHAERVGILLDIDIARVPHTPGTRPDFPIRLEDWYS